MSYYNKVGTNEIYTDKADLVATIHDEYRISEIVDLLNQNDFDGLQDDFKSLESDNLDLEDEVFELKEEMRLLKSNIDKIKDEKLWQLEDFISELEAGKDVSDKKKFSELLQDILFGLENVEEPNFGIKLKTKK